jgi:TetR/AcrR family transcriptional regulator, regulator of cefoperazone and chloramphenicol sensitivity
LANVKNNAAAQETRRKLIDAAGEVFAERGLHAATIKDITNRAGVNSAAINYHFRDKFELYAAVVRHVLSVGPSLTRQASGTSEERLRSIITAFVGTLHDPAHPRWHATVLAHELAQPTAALDAVMDELIRPVHRTHLDIVREILGPRVPETQVRYAVLGVLAQSTFYVFHNEVLRRLQPEMVPDENSEEVADYIAEFSLATLHAIRHQYEPRRRSRKRG